MIIRKRKLKKKIIKPRKARFKNHQLILELETDYLRFLLNKGRLVLKLNSCKIVPFSPAIKCRKCQIYGNSCKKYKKLVN